MEILAVAWLQQNCEECSVLCFYSFFSNFGSYNKSKLSDKIMPISRELLVSPSIFFIFFLEFFSAKHSCINFTNST